MEAPADSYNSCEELARPRRGGVATSGGAAIRAFSRPVGPFRGLIRADSLAGQGQKSINIAAAVSAVGGGTARCWWRRLVAKQRKLAAAAGELAENKRNSSLARAQRRVEIIIIIIGSTQVNSSRSE